MRRPPANVTFVHIRKGWFTKPPAFATRAIEVNRPYLRGVARPAKSETSAASGQGVFLRPYLLFKMRHTLTGNIQHHSAFPSRILGNRRDVLVYLPKGYRRSHTQRYPVLYLHDGQNVFDAATSFAGVEWGVDETAQRLTAAKLIEPIIIVAVANTGEDRIHE